MQFIGSPSGRGHGAEEQPQYPERSSPLAAVGYTCWMGSLCAAETTVQQLPGWGWDNLEWMSPSKWSTDSIKGALQNPVLFLSKCMGRNTDEFSHWANFQGFGWDSWSKWLSCLLYCRAFRSEVRDMWFSCSRSTKQTPRLEKSV